MAEKFCHPMVEMEIRIKFLVQFFYDGLNMQEQAMMDNAARGYFGDKTVEEIWDYMNGWLLIVNK